MRYFVFWCGHPKDSNGYYYVTASWVPYHIRTMGSGGGGRGGDFVHVDVSF